MIFCWYFSIEFFKIIFCISKYKFSHLFVNIIRFRFPCSNKGSAFLYFINSVSPFGNFTITLSFLPYFFPLIIVSVYLLSRSVINFPSRWSISCCATTHSNNPSSEKNSSENFPFLFSESGENITLPKLSHSIVNVLCLTVLTGLY